MFVPHVYVTNNVLMHVAVSPIKSYEQQSGR